MPTELKDVSYEELEAELARRRAVRAGGPPEPLATPDFAHLQSIIVEGIKDAHDEQWQDEDFKHHVYETAVEAVYGPTFWKWRNAQGW